MDVPEAGVFGVPADVFTGFVLGLGGIRVVT